MAGGEHLLNAGVSVPIFTAKYKVSVGLVIAPKCR
jgi:hypothetical protein